MSAFSTTLPIHDVLDNIKHTLKARHELVLEAPPGAGKTTHVPLALMHESWLHKRLIIMLEPRRVAARAAAERMASILNEQVGEQVGYRIRQEAKSSARTRILVVTEGVLTRWLQNDPAMEGVGLIIFDEFHERSLDSDLGLALSLQSRVLFRDDADPLKILLMSATLDGKKLADFLNAPFIQSAGQSFPVDIRYLNRLHPTHNGIVDDMCRAIQLAIKENNAGNLLAFLPGQAEIRRVEKKLTALLPNSILTCPLYGSLNLDQQRQAIAPLPNNSPYRQKIVLATDIAETSLTISGVAVVVDSGLKRLASYDPKTATTRLDTQRISKASSTQRAGRAGRLGPGTCYRLWTEEKQYQLIEHDSPEILRADLQSFALQLYHWGVSAPDELQLLDPPRPGAFLQAIEQLVELQALHLRDATTEKWQITEHGRKIATIPAHPRIAHMLICARRVSAEILASHIAALLAERPQHNDVYFINQLKRLEQHTGIDKTWRLRVQQQAQRFLAIAQKYPVEKKLVLGQDDMVAYLLALAFPDRIAKCTDKHTARYKLSNGRSAYLTQTASMPVAPWLVVTDIGGRQNASDDHIYSAAVISESLLAAELHALVSEQPTIEWSEDDQRFKAEKGFFIGKLLWKKTTLENITPEEKGKALIHYIRKYGLEKLDWNEACRQWCARVMLAKQHDNNTWPDVDTKTLLASLENWLGPYLQNITSDKALKQLAVAELLHHQLDWSQQQKLQQLFPEKIDVPSGSKIPIDYSQSPPVLAVKLQEMFGCDHQPAVCHNNVILNLHLLSPARRPLQITQDIAAFWRGSYHDVKKEMKGRYPKLTGTLEGCQVTGIMKVLTKPTRGFRNGYYKTEPNNDYSCHQACHC